MENGKQSVIEPQREKEPEEVMTFSLTADYTHFRFKKKHHVMLLGLVLSSIFQANNLERLILDESRYGIRRIKSVSSNWR